MTVDVLIVSGTRPEIIKLAPVYHALRQQAWAEVSWLHTGQHGGMAAPILDSFEIQPEFSLSRQGSSLFEFGAGCRAQLEEVMHSRDWKQVVVQGDTESTFCGALAGFYHRVPVAHVEAGLRTFNLDRPFPEEGLRQMVSRIARQHFAPTVNARDALLGEGIAPGLIEITGNTVVDAQQWVVRHHGIRRKVQGRGHLLVTMHRRENWGEDVAHVCQAVAEIARRHPEMDVLFPVHLNPLIGEPARAILGRLSNVCLSPPLDYLQMQQALADAWLVLSDSGGLQEEAPTFHVPLLVLREETERPEAIEAGCARLTGTATDAIVHHVEALWSDEVAYRNMQRAANPFGDGKASQRIADSLRAALVPDCSDDRVLRQANAGVRS